MNDLLWENKIPKMCPSKRLFDYILIEASGEKAGIHIPEKSENDQMYLVK